MRLHPDAKTVESMGPAPGWNSEIPTPHDEESIGPKKGAKRRTPSRMDITHIPNSTTYKEIQRQSPALRGDDHHRM